MALRQPMVTTSSGTILDWWTAWRDCWTSVERKGADSIFLLVAWELWKERNARCFKGANTQVPILLATLKHQAELWVAASAKNLGCLLAGVIL